jgi:hypothetical protein
MPVERETQAWLETHPQGPYFTFMMTGTIQRRSILHGGSLRAGY